MNPASGWLGRTAWKTARGAERSRPDSGGWNGRVLSPIWTATPERADWIAPNVAPVAPPTRAEGPALASGTDAGAVFAATPQPATSAAVASTTRPRTRRLIRAASRRVDRPSD